MTYPPQDPNAQPGQYGPSQPGAQPGGYAPGQAGGEPYPGAGFPPAGQPQYPGQEGQYVQYDPAAGYQTQYQQYGPPPVPATANGSSGTVLLVIGVVILMAIGGVAGYFLLGGDDTGELSAGDDPTSSENTPGGGDGEEEGGEESEEAPLEPSGTHLEVPSLSSVTPHPGEGWTSYYGPGESAGLLADSEAYFLPHTEEWISFFGVGLFNGVEAPYDPTDLRATAAGAAEAWLEDGFDTVEDHQQSEIVYTDVEVDGRPGVLAEWRNSWTSSPDTADLYEDTAILVVDVDGVNGFAGVASVSQSGEPLYDPAVAALLATDFDAETA